jgi:chemotaxis protein MotB
LQQDGVRSDQVTQVRGYADQLLRVKDNPTDPSNRRISILVKNDTGELPASLPGAKVVSGPPKAPVADDKSKAAGTEDKTKAPAGGESAASPAAPPAAPVAAPAKPSATATAVKPSLMDRVKAMMPGGHK